MAASVICRDAVHVLIGIAGRWQVNVRARQSSMDDAPVFQVVVDV